MMMTPFGGNFSAAVHFAHMQHRLTFKIYFQRNVRTTVLILPVFVVHQIFLLTQN